ncbi:MAG: Peptide deformylase, partial [uncultured Nocardioides sp.]
APRERRAHAARAVRTPPRGRHGPHDDPLGHSRHAPAAGPGGAVRRRPARARGRHGRHHVRRRRRRPGGLPDRRRPRAVRLRLPRRRRRALGGAGVQPGGHAARGQGPPPRRGRGGLPVVPRRLRRLCPPRLGARRRHGARRRAGDLRGLRADRALPPARDRPHPRHRLRRPHLGQGPQEAREGAGEDRRRLPARLARARERLRV